MLKRARYFITCDGKYFDAIKSFNQNFISENLLFLERASSGSANYVQTSLFDDFPASSLFKVLAPTKEDKQKCLTGML